MQCCCLPGAQPCPQTDCPCASSYVVNGINFQYRYAISRPGKLACECGFYTCYDLQYEISLQFTQPFGQTITRRICNSGTCGYYGDLVLQCNATVQIGETASCIGSPFDHTKGQIHQNVVDVVACLHVTCGQGGVNGQGCSSPVGANARVWRHTLEICEFPIACDGVDFMAFKIADGTIVPGADCDYGSGGDPSGLSIDTYGTFSLRCIGGTLSWVSEFVCLDTLLQGQMRCLGWYKPGLCMPSCRGPYGPANNINYGAFAVFSSNMICDPDDDSGQNDGICDWNLTGPSYLALKTIAGISSIDALLQSSCGDVNLTVSSTSCPGYDVVYEQTGCPSNHWLYT